MRNRPDSFATLAIHHGYDPMDNEGALTPRLHLTSTFAFENAEAGGEIFAGEQAGHVYSRISKPTTDLLKRRIAVLEGAEAGLALASGMGAITVTMWTLLAPGDEVIPDKTLYGFTFSFMQHGLAKFGVIVTHVDMTHPENLTTAISEKNKAVYFETPANPNMRLVDIRTIAEIAHAHAHDARVVVDNTYATPCLTRPIKHGADIVLHSATKYLGGNGDVVAGLLAGSEELVSEIRLYCMKDMTGAVMAPFNAMLVLHGIKTLELRMDCHSSSALAVAQMLEASGAVLRVDYPGLARFAQHDPATRQWHSSAA